MIHEIIMPLKVNQVDVELHLSEPLGASGGLTFKWHWQIRGIQEVLGSGRSSIDEAICSIWNKSPGLKCPERTLEWEERPKK